VRVPQNFFDITAEDFIRAFRNYMTSYLVAGGEIADPSEVPRSFRMRKFMTSFTSDNIAPRVKISASPAVQTAHSHNPRPKLAERYPESSPTSQPAHIRNMTVLYFRSRR